MTRKKFVPTPFSIELGKRIQTARAALGVSQAELADKLPGKIDQTQVSKWELGTRVPSAQSLTALARVLGRSVDWLVGLEDLTAHRNRPHDG